MNPFQKLLKTRWAQRILPAHAADGAKSRFAFDKVKAGLMLLTIAALSLMMSVHLHQDRAALRLNEVSSREIRAARSVVYMDTETTARLQQGASQLARPVYDVDERAAVNAHRTVVELYDSLDTERRALTLRSAPRSTASALDQAMPALQSASGLPSPPCADC